MPHRLADIEIETSQTLDAMLHQILNQALVVVGAEAGSLMMVANKRGILQIKARLGKPRPGRKTEPVYKIGEKGISGWVVQNKQAYLCQNIDEDKIFTPSFSGERNFQSLMSAPIIFEGKVLAVINADAKDRNHFTEEHRDLLNAIAQKVAIPIAERISILDALAEAGVELSRLPSEGEIGRVLQRIAELAVRSLGADVVTIYPYMQENDNFPVEGSGPTIAPAVRDSKVMRRKVYPNDVPWTVVKMRKPGFYSNVNEHQFLTDEVNRPDDPPRPRFIEREGIKSMAALLLPFRAAEDENEEVVGVMFANYRTLHDFSIDEISALATFADYAAIAILNIRHEEKRRAEQIKMLESMSANFAHRMNNLAGIGRLNVQMLKERIDEKDNYSHQLLDEIEHKSKILLDLAERLFRPFRATDRAIELIPVNLEELVTDEMKDMPIPSNIRVQKKFSPDLPKVLTVEFQLKQVIYDMLSNSLMALKHKKGGQVIITANYNDQNDYVEVSISDNGKGISDDIRGKLFNPGVTTKKESLGIGLWWCRTFLQATGGDVILKDTQTEKGSTFVIEIPCEPLPSFSLKHSYIEQNNLVKEFDILIIEDADDWRHKLVKIVEGKNYSYLTASNYFEARAALARSNFKLVILDLRLDDSDPENTDGLRILEDIEKANLSLKVIFISGYGTNDDRRKAEKSSNFKGFVDKGKIELEHFYQLIDESIN